MEVLVLFTLLQNIVSFVYSSHSIMTMSKAQMSYVHIGLMGIQSSCLCDFLEKFCGLPLCCKPSKCYTVFICHNDKAYVVCKCNIRY